MVNVRNVNTDSLIEKVKEELQKDDRVKVPEWVQFLKVGIHREKAWQQTDWYNRCPHSELRKFICRGSNGSDRKLPDTQNLLVISHN